jgi:hypothetical protein
MESPAQAHEKHFPVSLPTFVTKRVVSDEPPQEGHWPT